MSVNRSQYVTTPTLTNDIMRLIVITFKTLLKSICFVQCIFHGPNISAALWGLMSE